MRRPTRAAALLLALAALSGCGPKEPAVQPLPDPVADVRTVSASVSFERGARASGSVRARESLRMASHLAAYIRSMPVEEGRRVEEGTVLAALDDSRVQAAVRAAQAKLDAAEAQARDARIDLEKFEALYADDSVSEAELRKVRLRRDAADADLRAARSQLEAARSELDYTVLTAPTAGWIRTKLQHPGDLAAPGMPLLLFDSAEGPQLEVHLPAGLAAQVRPGDSVQVRIEGESEPRAGTVDLIVPSADALTRTQLVRIGFADGRTPPAPGRWGEALFTVQGPGRVLVPPAALVRREGLDGVFVVENGRARFQWVRVADPSARPVAVLSGLRGDETLVADPPAMLRDNGAVRARSGA